jgi:putative FmdB family regulatory protein
LSRVEQAWKSGKLLVCGSAARVTKEDAMPLYEYRCQSCGEKEEKLQGFNAPTEHDCPRCGKPLGMHREISLASFSLAGGGWHAQGYVNGSSGKKAGSSPAKAEASAPGGCAGGCACHAAKPSK